ncbi:hypothetical protein ACFO0N_07270 [Halobium salinum]|uniref:Small CPxCG-related zinc finger protein n=1 Tax=Halobium salinum TaxID=1364940 RepID=A0ABD5PAM5_9EURY|nr:hypothetical protein [Halobium salinum]
MSECLTCADELGKPGEHRYRLGPVDSFDWLGELCVDCGADLLERADEGSCLCCGDAADYSVRRLAHTGTEANTRSYAPDRSRAAFCEGHVGEWSPTTDGSVADTADESSAPASGRIEG